MKVCFKCLVTQPRTAFYKHKGMLDGRLGKCIACTKKDVKTNRSKHLEYYRSFDRGRGCRQSAEDIRKYRKENPEKYKAHTALNNAIQGGHIQKWPVCALPECEETRVVGHHPDYNFPLDVVWLCQGHHKQAHALVEESDVFKTSGRS